MRSEHPELARPPKRCLGALATVSWPWVPACGSLEPPRRDGENAQKTGKNGGKMGEIRPKTRKGVGITCFQVDLIRDQPADKRRAGVSQEVVREHGVGGSHGAQGWVDGVHADARRGGEQRAPEEEHEPDTDDAPHCTETQQ